jgi:hypothetical protein
VRDGSSAPFHRLAEQDFVVSDPSIVYKMGYPHQARRRPRRVDVLVAVHF